MNEKKILQNSQELFDGIEGAILSFNKSVPKSQQNIYDNILLLIKDLEVRDGKVLNNSHNLKLIASIHRKIEKAVINDEYVGRVKEFVKAYDTIDKLQKQYFKSLTSTYSAPEVIREFKKLSVSSTIDGLMEAGIEANLTNPIRDLLIQNVTTGVSYSDLNDQLKNFIIGNSETDGRLLKYTQQITTDSLNQYSANYTHLVAENLGLEWGMYLGSLKKTSRAFCKALVDKKYVHISELPKIITGLIDGKQVPIYKKTGLPYGMIPGTNAFNFKTYRGGYNCNHQWMPVPKEVVPLIIRMEFEKRLRRAG